ncbi:hypothetical protein BgiMline_022822, partial [Biomphalaria glabrata]
RSDRSIAIENGHLRLAKETKDLASIAKIQTTHETITTDSGATCVDFVIQFLSQEELKNIQ